MARFDLFFPKLMESEGGYQNDPSDRGNYVCADRGWAKVINNQFLCPKTGKRALSIGTNYGIAAPVLAKFLKRVPSVAQMKALNLATVKKIYKFRFWDVLKGDRIADQNVAEIFIDHSINRGRGNATKLLQKILNGLGSKLVIDGAFGPLSLAAVNGTNAIDLYNMYRIGRIKDYENLAALVPRLRKFLNGWINRVLSFPDFLKRVTTGKKKILVGIFIFGSLTALAIWGIKKLTS